MKRLTYLKEFHSIRVKGASKRERDLDVCNNYKFGILYYL